MELLVSLCRSVSSALRGEMDDETGMDRLARNDWFCKEDKGGRVLCFCQLYSFLHWFFLTGPVGEA